MGVALGRCLRLFGLGLWELVLMVWLLLGVCLTVLWVGLYLVPPTVDAIVRVARRQRRLARRYSGVGIAERYAPLPGAVLPDGDGRNRSAGGQLSRRWRRLAAQLRDPAVQRDLLWSLVDPVVGAVLVLVPPALVLNALWGVVLLFVWRPIVAADGTQWFLFVPVNDRPSAVLAAVVGVVLGVLGVLLAPRFVRWHASWAQVLLRPSGRSLERRVEELTVSRAAAVDDASAEVRRIERDLHDGAQARIVSMGMTLTAAERLMDTDPEAARAMIAEAKASSSAALQELRDLVRGIHPPVLADRGLVDAVRTLALEAPVPVDVVSTLDGRVSAPVESAVYFAVSELLANVAKHARATRASVEVSRVDGELVVVVADDGAGGASAAGGSGLAGISRRLGAFDGTLTLASRVGAGTVATVRVPVAVAGA
ncbi:signal transduction histidine kinase [Luteimicrobium subarcticum]|uniref:histidine kinase n=1 Tax=Luteimicrobium subarcticum TaxID=620910 RepID=A0A2M8WRV0_9MICO|nr:signal transduction histidine kinase [Luteimicrobium subarcticum]